ncbi:tyrosine-type recombinase/integrase [Limosilactobacillus reuteri]|uniref:tyrosine-type recombinase/integrase n=1 Tax=Limosilactobacillus reuteri TaxID=1598 RepID=UPI002B05995F|nr:tyrosine-type recombinase/integrase [Limosilactobacillus reuteri]
MWVEKRKIKINDKNKPGEKIEVIRYKFIERYKDPLTGKEHKVSVTYNRDNAHIRKAALNEINDKIAKLQNQINERTTTLTLKQLGTLFLSYYEPTVAPRTYIYHKSLLNQIYKDFGQDILVARITTPMLNRYFDDKLYNSDTSLSNSYVNGLKKTLSLLYKYANRYGYLSINPVKDSQITFKDETEAKRDRIENKYLTKKEYQKILKYCDEKHKQYLRDAFELQYLTGLRFGELSALQVKDVLKKDGHTYLDVNGTMVTTDTHPIRHFKSKRTKTLAGLRQVFLSPHAAKIVQHNCTGKKKDDWLISHNTKKYGPNSPLILNSVNRFLRRAAKEEQIRKKVTTHIFRHTHVSNLADMGVPLRVIQKRVGHADSEITRRIYLHVTKRAKEEFIDMIDKIDDTE